MAERLTDMQCEACHSGAPLASAQQRSEWLGQVPLWRIVAQDKVDRLERVFVFSDYAGAVAFANRIAELAEQLDHHPAILLEWGRVSVQWWTHKIGGLHRNDFIAAARTDALVPTQ